MLVLLSLSAILATEDPYQVLGLRKGSKIEDVKKQFRQLSLKYHPDKNKSASADQKFKQITNAYQQIIDGKIDTDNNQKDRGYSYQYSSNSYHYNSGQRQQSYSYQYNFTPQNDGPSILVLMINGILLILITYLVWYLFQKDEPEQVKHPRTPNPKPQQQQQNQQNQQFSEQQAQSQWKSTTPKASVIQERVSSVSSYTESNHRFKFYENIQN